MTTVKPENLTTKQVGKLQRYQVIGTDAKDVRNHYGTVIKGKGGWIVVYRFDAMGSPLRPLVRNLPEAVAAMADAHNVYCKAALGHVSPMTDEATFEALRMHYYTETRRNR